MAAKTNTGVHNMQATPAPAPYCLQLLNNQAAVGGSGIKIADDLGVSGTSFQGTIFTSLFETEAEKDIFDFEYPYKDWRGAGVVVNSWSGIARLRGFVRYSQKARTVGFAC